MLIFVVQGMYIIIALAFFVYPDDAASNDLFSLGHS